MNKINNLTSIFHLAIIAVFLLSLSGCGYKKAPYYIDDTPKSVDKAPQGDENVEFIIQKHPVDANQSVEEN